MRWLLIFLMLSACTTVNPTVLQPSLQRFPDRVMAERLAQAKLAGYQIFPECPDISREIAQVRYPLALVRESLRYRPGVNPTEQADLDRAIFLIDDFHADIVASRVKTTAGCQSRLWSIIMEVDRIQRRVG